MTESGFQLTPSGRGALAPTCCTLKSNANMFLNVICFLQHPGHHIHSFSDLALAKKRMDNSCGPQGMPNKAQHYPEHLDEVLLQTQVPSPEDSYGRHIGSQRGLSSQASSRISAAAGPQPVPSCCHENPHAAPCHRPRLGSSLSEDTARVKVQLNQLPTKC